MTFKTENKPSCQNFLQQLPLSSRGKTYTTLNNTDIANNISEELCEIKMFKADMINYLVLNRQ